MRISSNPKHACSDAPGEAVKKQPVFVDVNGYSVDRYIIGHASAVHMDGAFDRYYRPFAL